MTSTGLELLTTEDLIARIDGVKRRAIDDCARTSYESTEYEVQRNQIILVLNEAIRRLGGVRTHSYEVTFIIFNDQTKETRELELIQVAYSAEDAIVQAKTNARFNGRIIDVAVRIPS